MSILLWHGLQQGLVLDTFTKMVTDYNEAHTEQVELVAFTNYGDPANESLTKSEEKQPSIILAPEFQTSLLMTALRDKKIYPIGELLSSKQLDDIADIVKRTFGDANGHLFSLPINPSCGVIFTNQDILIASGRDPDWIPKSFEELEAVCLELKEKGLCEFGWTCAWPAAYLVEVPAAQQNIPISVPANGKQGFGTYQLGASWLIQHFLDLRRQQTLGVFTYAGQTNDARKPFIDRKVAFFLQGSTHHPLLQKEASQTTEPFTVGCGSLPTLSRGQDPDQKHAFPLGGAALWVLNNPQTQKMLAGVREFISYLAAEEFQRRWHEETAYVPVRKSLPPLLEKYYANHPVHKAVVSQTIEALLGEHSFGIHMPNWASARKELFILIEKILDIRTTDEEVKILLEEFDKNYSLPK